MLYLPFVGVYVLVPPHLTVLWHTVESKAWNLRVGSAVYPAFWEGLKAFRKDPTTMWLYCQGHRPAWGSRFNCTHSLSDSKAGAGTLWTRTRDAHKLPPMAWEVARVRTIVLRDTYPAGRWRGSLRRRSQDPGCRGSFPPPSQTGHHSLSCKAKVEPVLLGVCKSSPRVKITPSSNASSFSIF